MFQFRKRPDSPAILIVSDNPTEPLYESPFLRQSNLRLLLAQPDAAGLRTARREQPSVIIEELAASDDGCVDFTRRLREDPKTRNIPLILIAIDEARERAEEMHPDELLEKPLSRRRFFDAVRRFVPLPHRRTRRVSVNLRFTYRIGDRVGQLFSRDLSPRGAFLKSDRLPSLGSHVDLEFCLPGSWDRMGCKGVVRSLTSGRGPGRTCGFGVEFVDLTDDDTERLQMFIDRHPSA